MIQRELKRAVFLRFGGGVVVMGAAIFLLAGTLRYWEGWLFLAGYLLFFLTLRENSYAARTIRVEEGQSVISTGPYAVVRHPMYLSLLPMFICAPLALGSWWAVLPALTTPFFLALRIQDEEKVLLEQLPGYREYRHVVRWRLIPGVW